MLSRVDCGLPQTHGLTQKDSVDALLPYHKSALLFSNLQMVSYTTKAQYVE